MEKIQKMGRYYTAMLKTICGTDYDKIKAASLAASVEQDQYDPECLGSFCENKPPLKKQTENH
ncbi:hypothetical protein [Flavobacterium sp.]|uniref:hypothetical protein n=1 Tax=Flavobacterium sp. TaxID=239 RepID=UPI0039E35A70